MCVSCGCGVPDSDHGDNRHITLGDLRCAADAASLTVPQVVGNISASMAHWRGRRRVAKAADGGEDLAALQVLKARSEQRYTLGLAYPANRPDVGVAADGFRDFVGSEPLELAAWEFMNKRSVGLHHQGGTEGHGTVVESYIYRGPDWHIKAIDGSEQLIQGGDWLLGVVWDEPTWEAIKADEFNGFSLQGRARRRQPSAEALANLRSL